MFSNNRPLANPFRVDRSRTANYNFCLVRLENRLHCLGSSQMHPSRRLRFPNEPLVSSGEYKSKDSMHRMRRSRYTALQRGTSHSYQD